MGKWELYKTTVVGGGIGPIGFLEKMLGIEQSSFRIIMNKVQFNNIACSMLLYDLRKFRNFSAA